MDVLLLVLAIISLLLGVIGCLLPVLPGPPLSWLGLFLLQLSKFGNFSDRVLVVTAILALIVQILDYVVPAWGTKKYGGSKYGTWGSIIGLLVAIFIFPVLGIVLGPFGILGILAGPFFGAFIGESMAGKNSDSAMRAAFGSFVGFLAGTLMKLAVSAVITVYFIREIIQFS